MDIITEIYCKNIMPSVATIGFFDGVHSGHRFLISQLKEIAQKRGLKSTIITFPVHPRKVLHDDFQPRLLSTTHEKTSLLAAINPDYCILLPFSSDIAALSAYDFMKLLKDNYNVKCLLVGYDHRFGHNRSEGFEDYKRFGEQLNIDVILADECYTPGASISSSFIRKLITKGDVKEAGKMLTYNYSIEGKVIRGHKIGTKIGFPTANIEVVNKEKIIPANGVYAIIATIDGIRYKGMINIGSRPTVNNGNNVSIEANIFDFDGNLYGKNIKIDFVQFMREEKKFNSIDELQYQLESDKIEANTILK